MDAMPATRTDRCTPLNLVWCDLEFTHLDLDRARVMQAAMLVTTPELEVIAPPGLRPSAEAPLEGLEFLVAVRPEEAELASDWVQAQQGELLARCQGEDALPPAEVERRLIDYVVAACGTAGVPPGSVREQPLLAGNSVHKDQAVLERCMPALFARLHYRLVDVSGLKELRRRWYPQVPEFDKDAMARHWLPDLSLAGTEHDALYDVKCSLAELRYYRSTLFREPTA
jgi:oligoribonuclease